MIISIKNRVLDLIYVFNNRGILIQDIDYDFYSLPIYKSDLESD